MAKTNPTGYVRTIERKGGPAFYAKLKAARWHPAATAARPGLDEANAAARGVPDVGHGRGAAAGDP